MDVIRKAAKYSNKNMTQVRIVVSSPDAVLLCLELFHLFHSFPLFPFSFGMVSISALSLYNTFAVELFRVRQRVKYQLYSELYLLLLLR